MYNTIASVAGAIVIGGVVLYVGYNYAQHRDEAAEVVPGAAPVAERIAPPHAGPASGPSRDGTAVTGTGLRGLPLGETAMPRLPAEEVGEQAAQAGGRADDQEPLSARPSAPSLAPGRAMSGDDAPAEGAARLAEAPVPCAPPAPSQAPRSVPALPEPGTAPSAREAADPLPKATASAYERAEDKAPPAPSLRPRALRGLDAPALRRIGRG
ncbi:hypothetical protein [Parvularcula oceani]|uniref:hypothetical protein n=1 Tax=Parvularcula oceani TaxID=1247963 RepID=UPI0004E1BFC2|nr:hypothetical protein [Parvularcula oceani]